ncbi:hypothetical protein J2129_002190 [Methanofollis sp. W23]|nr:hypothetical protein [Methanofollis sp. W23]
MTMKRYLLLHAGDSALDPQDGDRAGKAEKNMLTLPSSPSSSLSSGGAAPPALMVGESSEVHTVSTDTPVLEKEKKHAARN